MSENDNVGESAEDSVTDALREKQSHLRKEADRIVSLTDGGQQIKEAETFVELASSFDEELGAAARTVSERQNG